MAVRFDLDLDGLSVPHRGKSQSAGLGRTFAPLQLLSAMFEVPSRPDIIRCIVSEESIARSREPEFVLADESDDPKLLIFGATA